jgi:hypothetical protein
LNAASSPATAPQRPSRIVEFLFDQKIDMDEVTGTIELARIAARSIYGPESLALHVRFTVDSPRSRATIDVSTAIGRAVAAMFLGYCRKEFGMSALRVVACGIPIVPASALQSPQGRADQ